MAGGRADREMERVTWRRYATGLYQPLGLRIIDQQVHVLGKDQITRLQDRDGNGEADSTSTSIIKARLVRALMITQRVLRSIAMVILLCHGNTGIVSKDGSRHEVIATGLRNPNGMGLGPNG